MTHWFARRETTDLLFYRVSRRELPQQTLPINDEPAHPDDVLDHIAEAMLFGEEVQTGTAHIRRWALGNREIDDERRYLAGHIGYRSERQTEAADRYDETGQRWVDEEHERERTARAPFVFDAATRILAVLKHPDFAESTIANVFTTILNRGENARDRPAVEWDVEGTLDEPDFWNWVRTADAVLTVTVAVKLPNPEASPEFDPLFARLEAREAAAIRDTITARDPERGLRNLEEDDYLRAGVRMASQGYGKITGQRRYRDGEDAFDADRSVDRHTFGQLPDSWPELLAIVVQFMLSRRSGG